MAKSNAVVIKTRIQAENIDALNRKAKCAEDLQNGTFVTLAWSKTMGDEVFTATKATDGPILTIARKEPVIIASPNALIAEEVEGYLLEVKTGGWMVHSPEVNKDVVGEIYKGLDPRNFVNTKNVPFDVVKLEAGDIIHVTKDFFGEQEEINSQTTATLTESAWVLS